MKHSALIFDLDGVLVDTAKYHYIAWKELADELGILFTVKDNERFKGVSRVRCMEMLLELGKQTMSDEEKRFYRDKKNDIYVSYVRSMGVDEVLPGVEDFLRGAKEKGYLIALGSASKNAMLILNSVHLTDYFDAIIDGTHVSKAKPDPEVFLQGAAALGIPPRECIVFEDAEAGILAAHAADMQAVGISGNRALPDADFNMRGFVGITIMDVEERLADYREKNMTEGGI